MNVFKQMIMVFVLSAPLFVYSMDQKDREALLRATNSLDELLKEAQQLRKKLEIHKQEKFKKAQQQQMEEIDQDWANWRAKL